MKRSKLITAWAVVDPEGREHAVFRWHYLATDTAEALSQREGVLYRVVRLTGKVSKRAKQS